MLPARLANEDVVRTYTWIAPIHDILAVVVERRARRKLLEYADVQNGQSLLEVAVGTGLSFEKMVRNNRCGWNAGIDITPAMLAKTRKRLRRTDARFELTLGSAFHLPYSNSAFDLVVNSYMLDMVPVADFDSILREFRRVLKPEGKLVLCNMTVPWRWFQHGWDSVYRLHPPLLGGCRGIMIAQFLLAAGFAVRETTLVSEWTFPSEVLLATPT